MNLIFRWADKGVGKSDKLPDDLCMLGRILKLDDEGMALAKKGGEQLHREPTKGRIFSVYKRLGQYLYALRCIEPEQAFEPDRC